MGDKSAMNEKKFYIAFDIDGTIFSSEDILLEAYKRGIEEFNILKGYKLSPPTNEMLFSLVGRPYREIFKTLYPQLKEEDLEDFGFYIRKYLNSLVREGKGLWYDGICETIKELKNRGNLILVASNGNETYIKSVLETKDILDFFEPIITLDFNRINTKGDILLEYINKYDIDPKRLIMVGDRKSDIDAAKTAGCWFVGTLYGHGEIEEISQADFLINSPRELLDIIDDILHYEKI